MVPETAAVAAKKSPAAKGGWLLLGAILLLGLAEGYLHRYRWTVLEQPIRIEEGFSLSRSFTVDTPTAYWLEIECHETTPPSKELRNALWHELAASYSLSMDGVRVASEDASAHDGFSTIGPDYTARMVGRFEAIPHRTNRLDLHITRSLPQLASSQPVVKVRVNPDTFKDSFVVASLLAHVSLVIFIWGGCILLPILWARIFQRDIHPK